MVGRAEGSLLLGILGWRYKTRLEGVWGGGLGCASFAFTNYVLVCIKCFLTAPPSLILSPSLLVSGSRAPLERFSPTTKPFLSWTFLSSHADPDCRTAHGVCPRSCFLSRGVFRLFSTTPFFFLLRTEFRGECTQRVFFPRFYIALPTRNRSPEDALRCSFSNLRPPAESPPLFRFSGSVPTAPVRFPFLAVR